MLHVCELFFLIKSNFYDSGKSSGQNPEFLQCLKWWELREVVFCDKLVQQTIGVGGGVVLLVASFHHALQQFARSVGLLATVEAPGCPRHAPSTKLRQLVTRWKLGGLTTL